MHTNPSSHAPFNQLLIQCCKAGQHLCCCVLAQALQQANGLERASSPPSRRATRQQQAQQHSTMQQQLQQLSQYASLQQQQQVQQPQPGSPELLSARVVNMAPGLPNILDQLQKWCSLCDDILETTQREHEATQGLVASPPARMVP